MSKIISTRLSEPCFEFLRLFLQVATTKNPWARQSTASYIEKLVMDDLTKILGIDAQMLNQRKHFIEACDRFKINYQSTLDDLGW